MEKRRKKKAEEKKPVEENSNKVRVVGSIQVRVSRHVLDTCRAQDQDVATRASPG